MIHVKVKSKNVIDNTGNVMETPTLLVELNGQLTLLWSLHRYLVAHRAMSPTIRDKHIQAVGLLLDYIESNYECFDKPERLFGSFAHALYAGTINNEGFDPSGLYWFPKRSSTANRLIIALNQFSDWMHKNFGTAELNPWREATTCEERLKWAALLYKSNHSFLGHLDTVANISETAKKARIVVLRRPPSGDMTSVKFFPEEKMDELFLEGFKRRGKEDAPFIDRYNWRDMAITILMHGGGLRRSETLHIWVHDAGPDPLNPDTALVRVYDPIDGAAPKDFTAPDGRHLPNREAYLKVRYGLVPRNMMSDHRRAGWKNPKMTDSQQNYFQVTWFPSAWGRLFLQVWKLYMRQRLREQVRPNHPYLFVSFKKGEQHGEMYTQAALKDSHSRAVRKIGLPVGKMHGTTEHGHRHAKGQRAAIAKLDPLIQQRSLNHKSLEAHHIYNEPTIDRVTKELEKANQALDNGEQLPMVVDIDAWANQESKIQKQIVQRRRK